MLDILECFNERITSGLPSTIYVCCGWMKHALLFACESHGYKWFAFALSIHATRGREEIRYYLKNSPFRIDQRSMYMNYEYSSRSTV